jgi:predicted HNH restriction endonuclease
MPASVVHRNVPQGKSHCCIGRNAAKIEAWRSPQLISIEYAKSLRGRTLSTNDLGRKFKVEADRDKLVFTLSKKGNRRIVYKSGIQKVLDRFDKRGSWKRNDYNISQNGSYLLAILKLYLTHTNSSTSHDGTSRGEEQSDFADAKRLAREQCFFARNPTLAKARKRRDQYTRQICLLNFPDTYGELGKNFAECHHLDPRSELKEGKNDTVMTNITRVVTLCANCHRMVHRKRSALTIERVKADFAEATKRRGGPYCLSPRS